MKEAIVLLSLMCSVCCYSQTKNENRTAKKVISVSAQLPVPVNPVSPVLFTTVEECDQMILAIDSRMASVKADKAKNAAAEENGWYNRMVILRRHYADKKAALQQSSK